MENRKLNNLLIEYLTKTIQKVEKIAEKGEGREVLSGVVNRPEDVEITIDRVGEEILGKLLKKYNLSAIVFSEPEGREIKNIKNREPEVYGSIDPFDGSVLFLREFEHFWYTALSFYDKKRNPISTGIGDILNKKIYLTEKDGNYLINLKTGKKRKIFPSPRERLEGGIVIASYLMSSEYSIKFLSIFGDLLKSMHPRALLYPSGGSYIYAYLADGKIDAYIMFDEPRSEIDPGFPIAKRAGCEIVSVSPDGNFENYEFIPGKQHEKIDLLIAASTPKLRDKIIKYYIGHKRVKF